MDLLDVAVVEQVEENFAVEDNAVIAVVSLVAGATPRSRVVPVLFAKK